MDLFSHCSGGGATGVILSYSTDLPLNNLKYVGPMRVSLIMKSSIDWPEISKSGAI